MALRSSREAHWKDVSAHGIFQNSLTRFSELFQDPEIIKHLPFFLFTDETIDWEKAALNINGIDCDSNGFVIIHRKGFNPHKQHWKSFPTNLVDILEWSNEDELIDYACSLADRNKTIENIISSDLVKLNLVGESTAWKTFLRNVIEAAIFCSASVLLTGESGTGKELVSRLIHTIDKRVNKKDIVLVDCTTVVRELSGSEFFGHEKGSYTNAVQSREGAFALANNGTLFLDEVGELPLSMQAELLRVIQEGTYKKIGGNVWHKTDFRLICATNRDLHQQVKDNFFRQDLYYRISDLEFRVPPLNDRIEDIPLLSRHFLREFFPNGDCPDFDDNVLDYLLKREYPGNIRELRQLIRRIALKHVKHKKITMGEIPLQDRPLLNGNGQISNSQNLATSLRKAILLGSSLQELKNKTMEEAIEIALDLTNGNKEQAAKKLGVTWRAILQFRKKIEERLVLTDKELRDDLL